jgi:hypothetical protein
MMSEWTEYNITMEWPKGDNIDYQVRLDGEWEYTDHPEDDWDTGNRIRYREREPEMLKVYCDSNFGVYMDIPWIKAPELIRLAAPIAAYYKDMKYMAMDDDGVVYVYEKMPSAEIKDWKLVANTMHKLIAIIPKEAMPDNWKTAIVELVHEGGKDGV